MTLDYFHVNNRTIAKKKGKVTRTGRALFLTPGLSALCHLFPFFSFFSPPSFRSHLAPSFPVAHQSHRLTLLLRGRRSVTLTEKERGYPFYCLLEMRVFSLPGIATILTLTCLVSSRIRLVQGQLGLNHDRHLAEAAAGHNFDGLDQFGGDAPVTPGRFFVHREGQLEK